jgi:pimeloyl-ACP methyl ester carboxylesterase
LTDELRTYRYEKNHPNASLSLRSKKLSQDPIGFLGRMNAACLMLVTPEFFKMRAARTKGASQIRYEPANFRMKPAFMTLDGVKIRYAKGGNPDGPTVLFLSPLPQSILCYDKTWAALSDAANLIALDMPGFGRSEGDMSYMTFAAQSAFLEKFITHQELSDVHIVAPDVAMPVAMHYAMHRDHKAKSLLIGDGPGILPSTDGSLVKKIVHSYFWRFMVNMTGPRAFIAGANQLGYLHYRPTAEEVADYVASYSGRIGQISQYFKGYPKGVSTIDPHIETLDLPVHVFWGDQDAFLGTDNAERLHKRLPKSEQTIFKNCGHFCYQDQDAEFTQLVQDWISGGYLMGDGDG